MILQNHTLCLESGLHILITLITSFRWVGRISVRTIGIARYAEKSRAQVIATFGVLDVHTACTYYVQAHILNTHLSCGDLLNMADSMSAWVVICYSMAPATAASIAISRLIVNACGW